jgi:hypothetical protein
MAKRITIGDRSYFLTNDTEIVPLAETIKAAINAQEAFILQVVDATGNILELVVSTHELGVVELDTDDDARGQISL